MTDHAARVREAKEQVRLAHGLLQADPTEANAQHFINAISRVAAAAEAKGRAEARAEAVRIVEGMLHSQVYVSPVVATYDNYAARIRQATIVDTLAALRGTEGT